MTFAITYQELSDIINMYISENDSEELDIVTYPLETGLLIHVKKFDTGSIVLRGKLEFHLDSFEDGLLTLRLRFRNFFYDMLKKVLMGIVIKIVMKKMKAEDDGEELDPMKFIHFHSNTVVIETDDLFSAMKIPVDLILIRQKEGSLAVAFNFRGDRLKELSNNEE